TRFLLIAGRFLVRGPGDDPVVHALQDGLALWGWQEGSRGRPWPAATRRAAPLIVPAAQWQPGPAFLVRLDRILEQGFVQPQDAVIVDTLRRLGIGPGLVFDPDRWTDGQQAEIASGFAAGQRLVQARSLELGLQRNGWTINDRGPRFGSDYLLRAGVAKDQPNVAIPEEALYPLARVDAAGRGLDGRHAYRIRFRSGRLPPVDAFWSITAYDDQGRMMPNAVHRYSIGDRTPGLAGDADGGLTLHLSSTLPAGVPAQNWLPVERDRPFYLMMRLYQPRPEVLQRRWLPPPIERLESAAI
ncbi:MAG: DUF1254 domain-containing protein, partial [Burkholderiales bacterium]|nr:DUF1254 domain-containing protein [Burkholderiales bacterium]